jgi:hypothetical protein
MNSERVKPSANATKKRGFTTAPNLKEVIVAIEKTIEYGMPDIRPILYYPTKQYHRLQKISTSSFGRLKNGE